jgi:Fe2+ or Zn2+ uptake regulation protein
VDEYVATDVLKALSTVIANSGFATLRHVIELQGVCVTCGFEQTSA